MHVPRKDGDGSRASNYRYCVTVESQIIDDLFGKENWWPVDHFPVEQLQPDSDCGNIESVHRNGA